MDIQQIKKDLIDDLISYSEAFKRIKALPKAWHTDDWAANRRLHLKARCEQCGSTSNGLVAQHLVHPRKFADIRTKLLNEKVREYYSANAPCTPEVSDEEVEAFKKDNAQLRAACPHCKRVSFRERKTMTPKYFCEKCQLSFDEPVEISYIKKLKSISIDSEIRHYILLEKVFTAEREIQTKLFKLHEQEISKAALLTSIELREKYISLENIVTFCKECASRMDVSGQLLCWRCKTAYFNYHLYDGCYHCYEDSRHIPNPFKERIQELQASDANWL